MAESFKRKKHLNIEYIEQLRRFAYVIDFRGSSVEKDAIALCYMRACKEVLLYYIGTGRWERKPVREKDNSRAPYIVHECESIPVTMTTLLKHVEEIHRAAEEIFTAWQAQIRTHGYNPLNFGWGFRR